MLECIVIVINLNCWESYRNHYDIIIQNVILVFSTILQAEIIMKFTTFTIETINTYLIYSCVRNFSGIFLDLFVRSSSEQGCDVELEK